MNTIAVRSEALPVAEYVSVIVVPETALTEPGYVRTMTVSNEAHAKHEFYAMAQMAYYQVEDQELTIEEVQGPMTITWAGEEETLARGMLICRDKEGELRVMMHGGLPRKKMLETANRYCTRWIRLDI
ncbi:MAG: hypothetical protein ACK5PS_10180 [Desulfopila sp.]